MEEVAANVMGKYLVNPEKYPDNETFQIFKSFLEKNTFIASTLLLHFSGTI